VANEIRIPIIGEDRASGPMREVGRSADVAALGARRLADALEAQKRAANAAADADLKVAKANTILAITERRYQAERVAVAQKLQRSLDDAARSRRQWGRAFYSGAAFRGLFGGGGGGAAAAGEAAAAAGAPAAAGGGGGLLDLLGSPAGIGAIAGAAGPAASLIDVLLGQGLGTAGAAAGGGLVAAFRPSQLAPAISNIKRTLSTVATVIGPSVGLIFAQFGKTFQGLAPILEKFFVATLPFMKQFFTLAAIAAKTILPAMTQALVALVKSGALTAMTQGFVYIIQGIAGFIKALGPGMKAGAEIFRAAAIGIKYILGGLGFTLGWLGKLTGLYYSLVHKYWDLIRHETAVAFDAVRHDIAAFFDAAITLADQWRHGWAHIWDTIYSDTIGVVIRGDKAIISWFQKLPGQVIGALRGLGHMLYGFARAALNEMWSGFKAIGGTIIGWIGNFAKSIWNKVKSFFGIASPSSLFYDIGKNLMLGLFHGIRDHAQHAVSAAAGAAGAVSGSAGAAQRYARGLLSAYGWGGQWAALNAVAMRESGWSLTARNPSSGAYGIAQFINGPSEYYQYGGNPNTVSGQVIAFFNYIRQRYGNPGAAWQHELNFGWYDKGGWLPPGLSLAYNATGRPEQVLPRGASSGPLMIRLEIAGGAGGAEAEFIAALIRKYVRVRGGNVQTVFGRA
jgi:hypothetical protein